MRLQRRRVQAGGCWQRPVVAKWAAMRTRMRQVTSQQRAVREALVLPVLLLLPLVPARRCCLLGVVPGIHVHALGIESTRCDI